MSTIDGRAIASYRAQRRIVAGLFIAILGVSVLVCVWLCLYLDWSFAMTGAFLALIPLCIARKGLQKARGLERAADSALQDRPHVARRLERFLGENHWE